MATFMNNYTAPPQYQNITLSGSIGIFDVIEKILCDGWAEVSFSAGEVNSKNYLEITVQDNTDFTTGQLVEVNSPIVQFNGRYFLQRKNGNRFTLKPYGNFAISSYDGEITGTVKIHTMKWRKLYRDSDRMVIKPDIPNPRCFMLNQNVANNSFTQSAHFEWEGTDLGLAYNKQYNPHIQIIPLQGWDDSLDYKENFNKYRHNHIQYDSDFVMADSGEFVGMRNKNYATNYKFCWFVYADERNIYVGASRVDRTNGDFPITGFGITENVYGVETQWAGGNHLVNTSSNYYGRIYNGFLLTNVKDTSDINGLTTGYLQCENPQHTGLFTNMVIGESGYKSALTLNQQLIPYYAMLYRNAQNMLIYMKFPNLYNSGKTKNTYFWDKNLLYFSFNNYNNDTFNNNNYTIRVE